MHLLKGHPQFATKGFVLKLCPLAKEITQVMPQFGVSREELNQLMKSFTTEFPRISFDTTLLDQLSELWWLDVLTNEKARAKMLEKTANADVKGAYRVMLEEYENDCYGKESCIESARDCFTRTQLLKGLLRKEAAKLTAGGKVLLVTHMFILQFLTADRLDENSDPVPLVKYHTI